MIDYSFIILIFSKSGTIHVLLLIRRRFILETFILKTTEKQEDKIY